MEAGGVQRRPAVEKRVREKLEEVGVTGAQELGTWCACWCIRGAAISLGGGVAPGRGGGIAVGTVSPVEASVFSRGLAEHLWFRPLAALGLGKRMPAAGRHQ